MRARLPSIAKRLIQFECGADTTVQFRGAIAFPHSAFARDITPVGVESHDCRLLQTEGKAPG